MLLVTGLPLTRNVRLRYATGELLTQRAFNGTSLVVLYGTEGDRGELMLEGQGGPLQIVSKSDSVTVHEQQDNRLVFSLAYLPNQLVRLQSAQGESILVLATTRELAGRAWFFDAKDQQVAIIGLDYVRADPSPGDGGLALRFENASPAARVLTLSKNPIQLDGFSPVGAFDGQTGASLWERGDSEALPSLPGVLARGRVKSDQEESLPGYSAQATAVRWQGAPRPLEALGVLTGHAWYRTEFDAGSDVASRDWNLWIEHGSDIVGIYANGTYLTTVSPLGTEIDNKSRNRNYVFPDLKPYLRPGKNLLAFRVEIWGHGSFMFPRGTLAGITLSAPSLGFDSVKGLWGKAQIGEVALWDWTLVPRLGGERAGFPAVDFDDQDWTAAALPIQTKPGEVLWYRTALRRSDLPDPAKFHAPAVLRLKGQNIKATLFVNGELIGRWLSDEQAISRGAWTKGLRAMWLSNDPDDFPIPVETLYPDNRPNVLAIALEDTSAGQPGHLDALSLEYNREERGHDENDNTLVTKTTQRGQTRLR